MASEGLSTELACLGLAGLLAALQLVLMSVWANLTMNRRTLVGPRDTPPDLPVMVGRLKRAFENMLESLVLFTVAVLVIELSGRSTGLTATAATVYLGARVLYVPAYASGVPWVRSAIWAFGFFATLAMLIAGLLG